jgi:hypothetical protein
MPRRSRRGWWIAVGVACAVIVSAGAFVVVAAPFGRSSTPQPAALSGPPTPTQAPSPADIGLGDGRTLLARVVGPVNHAGEDGVGDTDGVVLSDEFARVYLSGTPNPTTYLLDVGYETAAIRTWQTEDSRIQVQVIQFSSPSNARSFFADERRAFVDDLDVTGDRLILGLADSARFEFGRPDSAGRRGDILLALDSNLVVVVAAYRTTINSGADIALLQQQLTALAR